MRPLTTSDSSAARPVPVRVRVSGPRRGRAPAEALEGGRPAFALMGAGADALEGVRRLRILIVGCGSVGGRLAVLLSRLWVRGLILVDPKSFKAASLFTHDIDPGDIGQPKALSVARRCKAISPEADVEAWVSPIESLDLAQWLDVDLVVMSPDLMAAEVWVAQRCLALGIPLVHASVHGASLTAQVRFFSDAKGENGGCAACGYSPAEWDLMARQSRFSCEGTARPASPATDAAPATNSVGALCALAANLALTQVLRFVTGLGSPVAGTFLEYNAFTHRTVISPLRRKADCRLDHGRLVRLPVDPPLADQSLSRLAEQGLGNTVDEAMTFELPGFTWIERAACGCAGLTVVRRFAPVSGAGLSACSRCGARLAPTDFDSRRVVGAAMLGDAVRLPLARLGVRGLRCLVVRRADAACLLYPRSEPAAPVESSAAPISIASIVMS